MLSSRALGLLLHRALELQALVTATMSGTLPQVAGQPRCGAVIDLLLQLLG